MSQSSVNTFNTNYNNLFVKIVYDCEVLWNYNNVHFYKVWWIGTKLAKIRVCGASKCGVCYTQAVQESYVSVVKGEKVYSKLSLTIWTYLNEAH